MQRIKLNYYITLNQFTNCTSVSSLRLITADHIYLRLILNFMHHRSRLFVYVNIHDTSNANHYPILRAFITASKWESSISIIASIPTIRLICSRSCFRCRSMILPTSSLLRGNVIRPIFGVFGWTAGIGIGIGTTAGLGESTLRFLCV